MRVRRNDKCAVCGVELARVGLLIVLSTRGRRPRVQVCSKTWHVCAFCLPNIAERMGENSLLQAALAEFAQKVPAPRPMSPAVRALYEEIAREGC